MGTDVTIGVVVRNCVNDIGKIVNRICSLYSSTLDMEVIFVNDGSQDLTLSEILKHAPHLKMKYSVHSHTWKGLGFSRNVVLKNARGDYVVWVDDGTILSKAYVEEHVRFMRQYSRVGIAKGSIDFYTGSNRYAILENLASLAFYHQQVGKFTKKLPGTAGSVFRVKAARQVGGFDESLKGATEDMDIAYRILKSGWKIYITKIPYLLVYNEQFTKIWKKNFWYGYGARSTLHKHKQLSEILYKSTPPAGFVEGLKTLRVVYRLTPKKIAFLLPIYFSIIRMAFCLGFIKSYFDAYRHKAAVQAN